jgi:hypothetical protein
MSATAFVRHFGGSRGLLYPALPAAVAAMQDLSIQKRFDDLSNWVLSARTIVPCWLSSFSLTRQYYLPRPDEVSRWRKEGRLTGRSRLASCPCLWMKGV